MLQISQESPSSENRIEEFGVIKLVYSGSEMLMSFLKSPADSQAGPEAVTVGSSP